MAYIEKEKLMMEIEESSKEIDLRFPRARAVKEALDTVKDYINDIPAADVAPVVHGKWIDKPTGQYGQNQSWCSACGNHSGIGGKAQHKPYCPNCGAKMDGGAL